MGYDPKTLDALRRKPRQGRLELGEDGGGPRYFLDGDPVHAGTALELRLSGDRWVRGRFEVRWGLGTPPPALFYLRLWNAHENEDDFCGAAQVSFELPPDAILRWPAP